MYNMGEPRYGHDCKACIFLGRHRDYDVYYCSNSKVGGGSIIARWANRPESYTSSPVSTALTIQDPHMTPGTTVLFRAAQDLLHRGMVRIAPDREQIEQKRKDNEL